MGGAKNCPETPRQKMIGMMYLVLTAMLALNVSTDILKAFKLVDDSLHSTLETTDSRNQQMMSQFLASRNDNPEKNGPWYDKAAELTQRSDSLYNYIQNFKYQIALATDGPKKVDPEARVIQGNDNRDATTHYALPDKAEKPGVELKKMIEDFRAYLISIDPKKEEEFNTIFDTSDKQESGDKMISWEYQMFHDMPSGASVVLLTKLQNDIRNAQNTTIQYLRGQTDAGDLRVNKLNAYVIPNSNYVIRGGKYTAKIILAAVDSTQTPEYYVEGVRLNDQGIYEVPATGLGLKKYSGWISYQNPASGDMEQLTFSSEYSVGEPAVTISNTDLNIMYRGHDNKFSISVPGVSNDKIKVNVSGASVRQQGGLWIIKPGDASKSVTISVSAELDGRMQPMGSKEYRVKQLPPPNAYFSIKDREYGSGGTIPVSALANAAGTITASYGADGLLDLPFKVTHFLAFINSRSFDVKGNKFTKEQLDQINKLKKGGMVILQDIRATGPGGQELRLQPLILTVN
ncbi:MAG: gliding motility protein GldM [Paludibacteraceae bacterium]|nr:gliding motility protein GldM [Paludibacteraceae bacterium]